MASYTKTGYLMPGELFTVDGVTIPVVDTDDLKLNGVNQTINEWIRRGRIRLVSAVVNLNTYHIMSPPEKEGNKAGG